MNPSTDPAPETLAAPVETLAAHAETLAAHAETLAAAPAADPVARSAARTTIGTVRPAQVAALLASGNSLDLIDVRTAAEFREVHATGARCVPLDRLDPQAIVQSRHAPPGQPIYLICQSGARAAKACARFAEMPGSDACEVLSVEGGTIAWERAGLPVVRGPKSMSLERQVRIVAGSLVLIGVVLGALVGPLFYILSGFIGAGLVFAGITDTCGMGLLLARCPWNR